MILGQTKKEQQEQGRAWRPFFALLPYLLIDGRTAWLEVIEGRWVWNLRGGLTFVTRQLGSTEDPWAAPTTPPPAKR